MQYYRAPSRGVSLKARREIWGIMVEVVEAARRKVGLLKRKWLHYKITKNAHTLTVRLVEFHYNYYCTSIAPAEAQCPTQKGSLHCAACKVENVCNRLNAKQDTAAEGCASSANLPRTNKGLKKHLDNSRPWLQRRFAAQPTDGCICVVQLLHRQQQPFSSMSAAKMRATAI